MDKKKERVARYVPFDMVQKVYHLIDGKDKDLDFFEK